MSRIEPATGEDGGALAVANLARAAAQVLNEALQRRDLFDPSYWPDGDDGWRSSCTSCCLPKDSSRR